jgi:hypothetical protein
LACVSPSSQSITFSFRIPSYTGSLSQSAEKNPDGKIQRLREILAQALNQPELDPFDALANLLGGIME